MKLELFYFPECPYCDLVLECIKKLGIEQKVALMNTRTDPNFVQKLIKDNGRRTVPCLYINGKPMLESKAIIAWLENNYNAIISA